MKQRKIREDVTESRIGLPPKGSPLSISSPLRAIRFHRWSNLRPARASQCALVTYKYSAYSKCLAVPTNFDQ